MYQIKLKEGNEQTFKGKVVSFRAEGGRWGLKYKLGYMYMSPKC